jgi:GT2 family glycosyltransferase
MTTSPSDAPAVDAAASGFFADAADLALDEAAEDRGPDTRTFDRHRVTAVLVCHDGARWLPRTLDALAGLALRPARVVAVDTGSTDATAALLAAAVDPEGRGLAEVLTLPRTTGFGAAVAHAASAAAPPATGAAVGEPATSDGPVEWLWLLHDDCAPHPEALRALLAVADDSPSVGIVGPKVLGWSDPRRLVEVGVSISGSGRRETGVDRGELDQGQRDGVHDVLAVGSAGLLVRRDVWDALGGFDAALPLFREDVDLGWRATLAGHRVVVASDAVVHHAEAMARDRRAPDAAGGHRHRADRRSALHVLLVNGSGRSLPWQYLRLAVGSVVRALGLLLAKVPGEAADELAAAAGVLLRPAAVVRARRTRAASRVLPARAVRSLRPPPLSGLRAGLEGVAGLTAGRGELAAGGAGALESGPTDEGIDPLDARPGGRVRSVLTRPAPLVLLTLVLLALVAFRGLLWGAGLLQGGALLPAPDGAQEVWAAYAAAWHDVGVGAPLAAPAYLVPVAVLATLLLGKAWLAVDVLLLLAVPLAGLVAYLVLGRLVSGRATRVAAAVGYALLPATTGAVAAGRLGTATLAWLGPLVAWTAVRGLGVRGTDRAAGSWRATWAAGLLLAVAAAFVPVAWVLALAVGVLAAALLGGRSVRPWLRLAVLLAVPLVLLLPWTLRLLDDPSLVLLEAGAADAALADAALPAWWVAAANPGGPGVPPAWVTLGLLVAALAGLLRRDHRLVVAGAWVAALVGLAGGLALSLVRVTPPATGEAVPVWPGPATLLLGGGLVLAAAMGADGVRERLAGYGFGWRQPLAGLVAVAALLAPVLMAAAWVWRGAGDPLERATPDVLPAYVVAVSDTSARPRTLVVAAPSGAVASFALVPGQGRRLGDAEVAPPAETTPGLAGLVSDLLSGRADASRVATLAGYGVAFVELAAPADADTVRTLDSVPGLARVGAAAGTSLWRLVTPGARVTVVPAEGSPVAVDAEVGDPPTRVDTTVPASSSGGTLRLAEAADPGWRARLDDTDLRTVDDADGWAQAFALPAGGGRLETSYEGARTGWMVAQAVAVGAVVVLALPARRRRPEDLDDGAEAAPAVDQAERVEAPA